MYSVPYNGLAVVVSDSPVEEYEVTQANMLAHERVQERVMREFTLLPVRFGTVADPASPVQDLHRLLEKRFQEFDGFLTDMEGKVELGLKALWRDEKIIFEEIVAENPVIRRLRNFLAGKPPGTVWSESTRLGEMVKEALKHKKGREAENIMAWFRRIAPHIQENDIFADRMIVNAAFLVDKCLQEEFDETVARLDEDLGHRVVFKHVGLAPPYNFVNIVVNWEEL